MPLTHPDEYTQCGFSYQAYSSVGSKVRSDSQGLCIAWSATPVAFHSLYTSSALILSMRLSICITRLFVICARGLFVNSIHYIASLPNNARQFGHAVRSHWGIENSLHWILDVTLREDECCIRRGDAAENLCTLRHFALNLLKRENTLTKIRQKRLKAAWNDDCCANVLFAYYILCSYLGSI